MMHLCKYIMLIHIGILASFASLVFWKWFDVMPVRRLWRFQNLKFHFYVLSVSSMLAHQKWLNLSYTYKCHSVLCYSINVLRSKKSMRLITPFCQPICEEGWNGRQEQKGPSWKVKLFGFWLPISFRLMAFWCVKIYVGRRNENHLGIWQAERIQCWNWIIISNSNIDIISIVTQDQQYVQNRYWT